MSAQQSGDYRALYALHLQLADCGATAKFPEPVICCAVNELGRCGQRVNSLQLRYRQLWSDFVATDALF
jgi:hypothetical protein